MPSAFIYFQANSAKWIYPAAPRLVPRAPPLHAPGTDFWVPAQPRFPGYLLQGLGCSVELMTFGSSGKQPLECVVLFPDETQHG